MNLTVCYITNRRNCRIEWFLDSLRREFPNALPNVIVVDFFRNERDFTDGTCWSDILENDYMVHVYPKPNVWCGKHRLTKENWFAPSAFRSTALCLCDTDYIAYVDDLSVLLPGWGNAVREAMAGNYIALGAYKKVKDLIVEDGEVKSFTPFPAGVDSRWSKGADHPIPCTGDWMYGCSVAMPVEALLSVNGWDETCDGCGSEDYCTGIRMANAGWHFKYDRRMVTYESEELHHVEKPFIRRDYGSGINDKSHALLNNARNSKWCENYFGPEGIRGLRQRVLAGEPFPITQIPQHEFFTGTPLAEL